MVAKAAKKHVADLVDAFNASTEDVAAEALAAIPVERVAEVLDYPGLERAPELVGRIPTERALAILEGMSADRLAHLFRHLPDPPRSALLSRLDAVRGPLFSRSCPTLGTAPGAS